MDKKASSVPQEPETSDELNQYANKRQVENLFKAFKDDNHNFQTCPARGKCDPAKLKEYFYQHFKNTVQPPDPIELQNVPSFTKI